MCEGVGIGKTISVFTGPSASMKVFGHMNESQPMLLVLALFSRFVEIL